MSKVLLDHVPARTPPERHAAPAEPPKPGRSKIEAGVLGLVLVAILVFAAGFAILFPESTGSPTFWPTYRDPSGVFELRYPRGWDAEPLIDGVRLSDVMTVDVGVGELQGATVDQLAQDRIAELGDLGAAEAVPLDDTTVAGRPAAALRALAAGDGRVTIETYVRVDDRRYLTIAATAPPDRFDQATYDTIVDSIVVPGPDVNIVEDRVDPSRS